MGGIGGRGGTRIVAPVDHHQRGLGELDDRYLRAHQQGHDLGIVQHAHIGFVLQRILGRIDRPAGVDQQQQPVDRRGARRQRPAEQSERSRDDQAAQAENRGHRSQPHSPAQGQTWT